MTYARSTTRRIRRRRIRAAGLLAAVVAVAAALSNQLPVASPFSTTAPYFDVSRGKHRGGGLDADLRRALRQARADAAAEGVEIVVDSGRRSPERQQELLDEAIQKYGSAAEAARWVATPETSPHVSGDAIDVGPAAAVTWLSERGAAYGLCQIYANEPWHYELRPDAAVQGCPSMYPDPTHDPRMQR